MNRGVGECGRVCGCEVDAAMKVKDEDQLLTVKALNEIDLRAIVLCCTSACSRLH